MNSLHSYFLITIEIQIQNSWILDIFIFHHVLFQRGPHTHEREVYIYECLFLSKTCFYKNLASWSLSWLMRTPRCEEDARVRCSTVEGRVFWQSLICKTKLALRVWCSKRYDRVLIPSRSTDWILCAPLGVTSARRLFKNYIRGLEAGMIASTNPVDGWNIWVHKIVRERNKQTACTISTPLQHCLFLLRRNSKYEAE